MTIDLCPADRFSECVADFISDGRPTWTLTLATNYKHGDSRGAMLKKLERFMASCDRGLLGRGYYKRPAQRRLLAAFLLEKLDRNAHVHALVRCPDSDLIKRMNGPPAFFEKYWLGVVPSGTVRCFPAYDPSRWQCYSAKTLASPAVEETIYSSDFWPTR